MALQRQETAVGVDHGVTLAPLDLLACIIAAGPPASPVSVLWLSITAAVGLAPRPTRSRSIMTRWWFTPSHSPRSRNARNLP